MLGVQIENLATAKKCYMITLVLPYQLLHFGNGLNKFNFVHQTVSCRETHMVWVHN